MTAKNHANKNRAFVLLFSFMSVHLVNLMDAHFDVHYLSLALVSLLVIRLSTLSKDEVLLGYAIIQLAAMVCYVSMITSLYIAADSYLYGGFINLSIIMLLYEIMIMFFVGGAGVRTFIDWMRNDSVRRWNDSSNVNKVSK